MQGLLMTAGLYRSRPVFVVCTLIFGSAVCLAENDGTPVLVAANDIGNAASTQSASGADSNGACELDSSNQEMLERVNQARSQARQCGDAHLDAAQPVTWSCPLERAARVHSQNMAKKDFFSHSGPEGQQVSDRVDAEGYTWSAVGENIAAGQPGVSAVVDGWLSSPGHCSNIMDPRFTEMGAASAEAQDRAVSPYWTQVFARPR